MLFVIIPWLFALCENGRMFGIFCLLQLLKETSTENGAIFQPKKKYCLYLEV